VFALRAQKGKFSSMNPALLEMPTRMSQPFEAGSLGALDATASGETRIITRTDENLLRQMTENLDKKLLSVLAERQRNLAKPAGRYGRDISALVGRWETPSIS
jgi:hypothetical protein